MPPLTSRIRLNLQQKQKIIEESKKLGFKREKIINEYGINKGTLSVLLKKQKEILEVVNKGTPLKNKALNNSSQKSCTKLFVLMIFSNKAKLG